LLDLAATRAAEGEMVTFRDGKRTPIYTYSKAKLIELFEISPDDQRQMTRLISDEEKERRRTERRRDAGEIERADYEARADQRRIQAVVMREQGMSLRAIGAKLGVSHEHVRRYLQG
jgi:hypothetical protein